MGILQGASGVNDNTLVYIVNALNGEVKQVNTLATTAGIIARQAEDGVAQIIIDIVNVRDEFSSALDLKANLAQLTITQDQVADLQDQYGNLVAEDVTLAENIASVSLTATNLTTEFTQIRNDLDDTDTSLTEVRSWIQESADGILLGKSNSPVKLRITNSAIEIIEGNNVITYWNNQAQLTPQSLIIPVGGSLTFGNFRWVPRSSGNLSLVKV